MPDVILDKLDQTVWSCPRNAGVGEEECRAAAGGTVLCITTEKGATGLENYYFSSGAELGHVWVPAVSLAESHLLPRAVMLHRTCCLHDCLSEWPIL